MSRRLTTAFFYLCSITALTAQQSLAAQGPSGASAGFSAAIEGTVCDTAHRPLTAATVTLETPGLGQPLTTQTDAVGRYRFAALPGGTYTVRVKLLGYREETKGPVELSPSETKSVLLLLQKGEAPDSRKIVTQQIEFSDEPAFTVAGITDPTNLGGHGSDVVLRTQEALAKDTVSLDREDLERAKQRVASMHGHEDSAELHALLGDIAEHENRPLEAVREYQRAAEMEPSEANLFAWGAELLLHRALEPATEVFTKGHRLFPGSVRMLVGLGVTSYARGAHEQATKQLLAACDMNPADVTPYLFLGRILEAEKTEPPGLLEALKRFASLQPENTQANYYYAVGLANVGGGAENFEQAQSLLQKAIELDPRFGDAYLQLGILYAERGEYPKAIAAYQSAIENTKFPDQAHYRLAQVYRQTGELEKARKESAQYNQVAKEKTEVAERDRHEIGQFVYTLKGETPTAKTTPE